VAVPNRKWKTNWISARGRTNSDTGADVPRKLGPVYWRLSPSLEGKPADPSRDMYSFGVYRCVLQRSSSRCSFGRDPGRRMVVLVTDLVYVVGNQEQMYHDGRYSHSLGFR
jgi:hypothetical protein